jgi:endonuclease YncB( thermonuclease family)
MSVSPPSSDSRKAKSRRGIRTVVLVLLALSLFQYLNSGTVTWPGDAGRAVMGTLTDFAGSSTSGWRRAADAVEKIGAAREGEPVPAFDLEGRVVRVADGDTVSLLDADNTQHKVRLFGIDTPEQDQPYGRAAKKVLLDLVAQQTVGVVVITTDSYGRKVGTLYHEGVNINVAMVERGYAWWYQHFAPHERKLAASEQQARHQRLGLWADPHPVPPWDWRRGQRRAAERK